VDKQGLNIKSLVKISFDVEFLDENHLWGKLVDGLQTYNGLNNSEMACLIKIDIKSMECWKVKPINPSPKYKSKILELVKETNKGIKKIISYSEISWKDLLLKIKNRLNISNTLLAKLLECSNNQLKGILKGNKILPKLRKEILNLTLSIKDNKDIRDTIFEFRKKKFFHNNFIYLRYIRDHLDVSQSYLVKLCRNIKLDEYQKFELGYKKLSNYKIKLIEKGLESIAKRKNLDYNELKRNYIKKVSKFDVDEMKQWNQRGNIPKIIGFRMMHRKEKSYLSYVSNILIKQNFTVFKNVVLSDKNFNTFDVDIYAFKKINNQKFELCFEVRDRCSRDSTNVGFPSNINRLHSIKNKFDFNYCIFVAPNLSIDKKRSFNSDVLLFDNQDLLKLNENYGLLELIKKKNTPKVLSINTTQDVLKYMKQTKLNLRDISFITGISFSWLNQLIKKGRDLGNHKNRLNKVIDIVNSKGVGYIKFHKYKKIYTNPCFLRLRLIKRFLNLTERDFKKLFGIKPCELIDKCLINTAFISKEIINKIKSYVEVKNYSLFELNNYIESNIKLELKRWKDAEDCNNIIGWKIVKLSDNSNRDSNLLENKTHNFLSKKYKYSLKNVQIYLNQTNQFREIDILSLNDKKDILVTECKLNLPGYGSKVILNDLDVIKKSLNAKDYFFVTPNTNLDNVFGDING